MVEIKESGAAGALGVIGQVNGRATAILSSFAAALGLDAPVEVGWGVGGEGEQRMEMRTVILGTRKMPLT